jgi:hypothetical protein
MELIENYRRTTYEPKLGHEDHFGFKGEVEVEEWPGAAQVQEILQLAKGNHSRRLQEDRERADGLKSPRRVSASKSRPPSRARLDVDELTREYKRVIGGSNPFRSSSAGSRVTLWPDLAGGKFRG